MLLLETWLFIIQNRNLKLFVFALSQAIRASHFLMLIWDVWMLNPKNCLLYKSATLLITLPLLLCLCSVLFALLFLPLFVLGSPSMLLILVANLTLFSDQPLTETSGIRSISLWLIFYRRYSWCSTEMHEWQFVIAELLSPWYDPHYLYADW